MVRAYQPRRLLERKCRCAAKWDGATYHDVRAQRAGRETFEIVDVGGALKVRTRANLALPAGATTIRGTLRADLDWKPLGANVIAHLTPLCRYAAAKEKSLTVFPAAPLKVFPRAYAGFR